MPKFDTIAPGREPIASYQHILELGRGGMGTVNLARAVGAGGFERLVVVKRLNPELLDNSDAVRRFKDEARQAALIHHANVVGMHQIGRDKEGYFLVLDYVEGTSLDGLVDRAALRGERVPPPIVLRIGLDALAGLQAAHSVEDAHGTPLGLLHRDVSLQNVLIGRDGVTRLADFGIAKSRVTSVVTDTRYMVGKLLYSSPEYLWRRPVGPALDVYGLGVTLWIALAGCDPWPPMDEAQLMAKILHERIPRLSEAGIRIAPVIDALIARACEPDVNDRFQTAREMADAVESIGRETGWLAGHAEVAQYLEGLLGPELRERRDRVAAFSSAGSDAAPLHESVAPPAAPIDPTRLVARPEESTLAVASSEGPRLATGPLLAVVIGVVITLGAGAWVWGRGETPTRRYEPLLAAPSASMPPAATQPASMGTPTASAAPAEPESPSPLVAAPRATTKTPSPAGRAVDPETLPREIPVAPRALASAPTQRVVAAPVGARSQSAAPTSGSDGISKTNPYR